MCILADSIKNISKTKIASLQTAYSFDNGKTISPAQLVVYSVIVDSNKNTNAIVLPIYNPGNDYHTIIPLDFSAMESFFTDLEKIYNDWFPVESTKEYVIKYSNTINSLDTLPVFQVGDYKFSIMPSKIDFNRLNRSQLNISPIAKTTIDTHSNDYSFIIYQFFQKGNIKITPFAYLCNSCRQDAMIIPTIHGHPHDDVPIVGPGYFPSMYISNDSEFENYANYDHKIFSLIKSTHSPPAVNAQNVIDLDFLLQKIKKDYMGRNIRVYAPKFFIPNKITIQGSKDNRNILVKPTGYIYLKDLVLD